jgi:ubiquinone/menaquinone biosynthesis C-methylase UbiE
MEQEILEAHFTHEEIVRKYDRIASFYDLFGVLAESKARKRGLALSQIRNGETILEVALGTGLNFVELLKRNPGGWVEGIDVSVRMLQQAEKRIVRTGRKNYRLQIGDGRSLPHPDATFDLLMNQYMLDILPVQDFMPILREFYRVLRKGGRAVLINTTKGERWHTRLYEQLYKLRHPFLAGSRGVLAEPFLREAGFVGIRRESVSQFGFPSEVVIGYKRT